MQTNSIEKHSNNQIHPYEYLTELNSIYSSCNKANAKSYSSVSTFKLAWKPFSIIKIPNCFQVTYESSHSNIKQNKCEIGEPMDEYQKKIWKDHQEILTRYYRGKQNPTKLSRPQTGITRTRTQATEIPNLNHHQSHLLLKRMREKGVKLEYNKDEVKQEVLKKLKKIQTDGEKKKVWRVQSAKNNQKKDSKIRLSEEKQIKQGHLRLAVNDDEIFAQKRPKCGVVQQNEYLNYTKKSDIVGEYKKRIKQVDCAIDDYNVKKAASLLRNMESIVKKLE